MRFRKIFCLHQFSSGVDFSDRMHAQYNPFKLIDEHFKKGQFIFVRGPVSLKSYINKEGQKKEYLEINAYSIGQALL